MNQRKNIDRLNDSELGHLRVALQKIKNLDASDPHSYTALAAIHRTAPCPHHTELFLPWHRAYILRFEQALQKMDPGVTLPFWNWISSGGIPKACQGDATNPLFFPDRYTDAQRQRFPYPTQAEVNSVLGFASFPEFGGGLESSGHLESGPHGEIHDWVSVTMSFPTEATNDPIFWLHHCYVDYLWSQWQESNHGTPSNVDAPLPGLTGIVRDMLSISTLKYEYVDAAFSLKFPDGLKASGSSSEPFQPPAGSGYAELRFEQFHVMAKNSVRLELTLACRGQTVILQVPLFGFVMDMDMPMEGMHKGTLHVDVTGALDRLLAWEAEVTASVRMLPSQPNGSEIEVQCDAVRLVSR